MQKPKPYLLPRSEACGHRAFRRAESGQPFPTLLLAAKCIDFLCILLHEADSAAILPFNLPYEADSAAIWPFVLLYEADSDAILHDFLPYEADHSAILLL